MVVYEPKNATFFPDIFSKIAVTVKPLKTICPKHGNTEGFNVDFAGTKFCLHCVKEKMVELGVCEISVKNGD